jgi:membrane associated rhomboid family serine protease
MNVDLAVERGQRSSSAVTGETLIPLSDATRNPLRFPVVTTLLIVANVIVFIIELVNGDAFVERWSLVPAHIVAGQDWITIMTAMFMHASWEHIIGNMIFLWAFGPELEDAMSSGPYLLFYLLGGLVAMLAQVAADPTSTVPNLGASGAIAAVMGGFLITFPRDKIRTVLFLGFFFGITAVPAILLIGFWFLTQLFSAGAIATTSTGGVAYMAHVGGFIFGAVCVRLFENRQRLAERLGDG